MRNLIAFEQGLNIEDQPLYNNLASEFDMRAAYPNLALFVATKEQQAKLESLLGLKATVVSLFSDAIEYHVVFGKCASMNLPSVFGKGAIMVGKEQAVILGLKGKPLAALEDLVDPHEDVCSRNTIAPAAMRPLRRSRYFPKAGQTPKNPQVIQQLVNQVQQSRLESINNQLAYDFGTPNSRNSESAGLDDAVAWAVSNFTGMGLDVETIQHTGYPSHSPNVCATLRGRTNALVVAHAHLDSRNTGSTDTRNPAPGADDNGSGSAAVLEIASIISSAWRSGQQFEHSILFCLWTGEEQGLLGSRFVARDLANNDADIIAAINSDMIGYRVNQNSILALMSGSATASLNNAIDDIVPQYVPEISEIGRTNAVYHILFYFFFLSHL